MPEEHRHRTGLYDKAVQWLTKKVEFPLHDLTERTVKELVAEHAPNDPEYARRIAFEVKRRGDGAGMTQDVSEPAIWALIKIAVALATATATSFVKNKTLKWVGWVAAAPIIINQGVDLVRLLPRYRAGLFSSFLMAQARQKSIDEGHGDPFVQASRQTAVDKHVEAQLSAHPSAVPQITSEGGNKNIPFSERYAKGPSDISPTTLLQQAEREPVVTGRS